MKKTLLIGLLAFIGLSSALTSCKEKNEPDPKPSGQDSVALSISPKTMTFDASTQESQKLVVTYSSFVNAVSDADWCIVEGIGGAPKGEYHFNVSCRTNYDAEERSTVIRILRINTVLDSVVVTQAAADTTGRVNGLLLGLGWNLGNQFDAFNNGKASETAWGNPKCTQATFNGIKAAGFNSVRIPVTWLGHIGDAPDYKIDDDWMEKVATAIGYAEVAGLKAIINIHHDGGSSKYWLNISTAALNDSVNNAINAQLYAMWTQIANRFKDKGDWLMFETLNEIQDGHWGWGANRTDGGKQYAVLNGWNQTCVNAIRATGGNNATRWIGVPGYSTNLELTLNYLVLPTDPANRIAVAIHCYDPNNFTLEDKVHTWGTDAEKSSLETTMRTIRTRYLDQGIQAYMGEFGCVQRADEQYEQYRLDYLAFYAKTARNNNLSIMLWDNGAGADKGGEEANAFIHHGTGDYISEKGKAATEALVNNYK